MCNFLSTCTEKVSQKGRLFVWSVSNTQGIVRRVLYRLRGNWESLRSGEGQKSPNSQGVAHEDGEVCRTRCTGHSMVEGLQKV